MKHFGFAQVFGFLLLFLAVMSVVGCAGKKPRLKDEAVKPDQAESEAPDATQEQSKDKKDDVFVDGTGKYRIVRTPFGYVKRRIQPPEPEAKVVESAPETRPAAPPTAPRIETTMPAPPPAKAEVRGSVEAAGDIIFNFDNADLYEVVRTMGELLRINYIVDPNVRGKVTIHTARGLRREDIFPVFFQILELNGLTAVKEGNLYRIIGLKDAPRTPILSRVGREAEEIPPSERVLIQIIPLEYISVAEMTKLLSPFISAEGTIISHGDSNTLLIVDKGINIVKILRLVEVFDVDVFAKTNYRFYQIENMDAEELAKTLSEIMASYVTARKVDIKFIAITRLNTLLTISASPQVFEKVEEFIQKLDVPSEEAESKIYVYSVKNGEAAELAGLLNSIFAGKKTAKAGPEKAPKPVPPPPRTPFARVPPKKEKPPTKAREATEGVASASLKGEIKITADEIRNSLIIEAIPGDYRIIANILKRLDVLPRQVLIEVTIAEISLDESTQLGIEWTYLKGPGNISTSLLSASLGASGLQYSIGKTDRFTSVLNALASKKKVNILSTPSVLASDNKEARIDISTEIPVASAQYQFTAGEEPVLQTNIQYRNTGVILGVTPHINERGLVSMDITQEVSEQAGDIVVAGQSYPSFFKRSVNTTLTVGHAQTIVIGGLISETKDDSVSGVPCLVDLPAFRWVFGTEKTSIRKTELIILITPHVIASLDDVDAVTEEFKSKVGSVMKEFKGKTR
ncbi:MAG: type II secretion system secretin GspD [Desulfobacterales bacterium]|nr:type II secretion system secretin GspD [Desulfobacterales bacterium]